MNSKLNKYRGIFPAFYACYEDNGDISPERTQKFTEYLIEKGVHGLYVGGSSGECIYQNIEERKIVLESVMKAAKGKITIIAHVAAPSTRDSIELAKHAEALGVDAIAAIPPIYFVLPEHAIYQYWTDMIDATALDFIIYNIPGTTQYSLSMNLFHQMLKNKKVIGVKNSSLPTQDIQKFKAAGGEDFVVFNGPDEQFVSGRIIGADAGIGGTYAVMPELFLAADKAIDKNDNKLAQEIQFAINDIIFTSFTCKGNMYAAFKEILKRKGMNIGGARLPLAPVAPEDEPTILALMEKIDSAIAKYAI
jgi:N-acetylneuraminate lyase